MAKINIQKRIGLNTRIKKKPVAQIVAGSKRCADIDRKRNSDAYEQARRMSVYLGEKSFKDVDDIVKTLEKNLVERFKNDDSNIESLISLILSCLEYDENDVISYSKIVQDPTGQSHSIKMSNIKFNLQSFLWVCANAIVSGTLDIITLSPYSLIKDMVSSVLELVPCFKVDLTESSAKLAFEIYKKYRRNKVKMKDLKEYMSNIDGYDITKIEEDIKKLESYKCLLVDGEIITLTETVNLKSFEKV